MNNINSLLDMVKFFESKGMKKNSKILNIYLVELMEKTLLKDYLAEEYENAKVKLSDTRLNLVNFNIIIKLKILFLRILNVRWILCSKRAD